jgi:IclR family transcriptional regulator, acetate operon repressor
LPENKSATSRNPLSKSYAVLRWMAEDDGLEWGLREIARGVQMHPSTVHRLVSMLEEENLIRQDPGTGKYALGLEFMRLSWLAARKRTIALAAQSCLRQLAEATGETALLGVYDDSRRQMMYVATVESQQAVRHVMRLHEWLPIHGGATGWALLAFQPEDEREAILTGPLPALTPNTITDEKELRKVIDQVRSQGYAIGRGGRIASAAGVAAPVLDSHGTVLAVAGVGMPSDRLTEDNQDELVRHVLRCAECIAAEAGALS